MYCNCFLPTENNSINSSSIDNRSRTTAPTKVYLYPYSMLKRSYCSIITNKLRKNYNLSHCICFKKELIRVCMQSTTFDNVQYLWNSFQNKRNEYLFCFRSFFTHKLSLLLVPCCCCRDICAVTSFKGCLHGIYGYHIGHDLENSE